MHHHSQSMGGVRRTSHMRVNMSKRAIYLLLPPTARIKELESWSREEEEAEKAWWEGWRMRETAKMTDRCFLILLWTFLAESLQPALGLSALPQSLKDFDRRLSLSFLFFRSHQEHKWAHTHLHRAQYGKNKHLKTTGRVGKIPEVNQPGKQDAMERLTHEWRDTVKDLHNFPRKNFTTFNCKILMATPFIFPWMFSVPVFLGHFSLQPPIKWPWRRSHQQMGASGLLQKVWFSSGPNASLGITVSKFDSGVQPALSTLENPSPKHCQV